MPRSGPPEQASSGDELRQAVALSELAAGVERSKHEGPYPHFNFVLGVAESLQGKLDRAMATIHDDAAGAIGPAPRLVRFPALQRTGHEGEARRALEEVITSPDW